MAIPERWKGHRPLPEGIKGSLEELKPFFEREGVILAYLFGSLAKTGEVGGREPQDVDLALLTREKPVWKLRDEIADALGTDRLDIVDLRRASPVLLFEIIRSARLIYSSDEAVRERFVLDVLHLYRDTAPLRRRQRAALKRRMDRWCEESR
ncbi:type VII toxin-antitoxin system MntA family adenylyltransferase antitoxin [Candidatus Methanocrinis natronophilus]|uniref:Nucleotidyltransferase domain-containing protein n=1 Tax=Candidatus Methanocrinis natronophilus TaxID=3033396 RepID=A0ABT5X8Q3_9EURY|nr:nucleotidyltransferase domain-containing protein [Candidatus Methanocrinis natronophilus]MDF0591079.1 nucleotidyltransferase domain-containing protein [Candidatus Methanocrinis natronophilus]